MNGSDAVFASPRPLLRICGTVGLIGCGSVVTSDVIAWTLVEGYDPISQTISALAVGKGSWLIDLGLCLFATGCLSVAFGMWIWRLYGPSWRLSTISVALLGVDIMVIAAVNQYAGKTNPGADVHINAVYALGLLFALACLFATTGLRSLPGHLARYSVAVGLAWIVLSPIFFFVPDAWSGAYERFLGLVLVGGLGAMSWLLMQRTSSNFQLRRWQPTAFTQRLPPG